MRRRGCARSTARCCACGRTRSAPGRRTRRAGKRLTACGTATRRTSSSSGGTRSTASCGGSLGGRGTSGARRGPRRGTAGGGRGARAARTSSRMRSGTTSRPVRTSFRCARLPLLLCDARRVLVLTSRRVAAPLDQGRRPCVALCRRESVLDPPAADGRPRGAQGSSSCASHISSLFYRIYLTHLSDLAGQSGHDAGVPRHSPSPLPLRAVALLLVFGSSAPRRLYPLFQHTARPDVGRQLVVEPAPRRLEAGHPRRRSSEQGERDDDVVASLLRRARARPEGGREGDQGRDGPRSPGALVRSDLLSLRFSRTSLSAD